jgi:hypothetical protein
MRRLVASSVFFGLTLQALVPLAAPLDGSAPMLCAFTSVVECSRRGECERSSPDGANVPAFIKVNVPQRVLSTIDGGRSSPVGTVLRENGVLMLQGMQNGRAWGAAIDEKSGQMSASITESDGAIVISGACIAP